MSREALYRTAPEFDVTARVAARPLRCALDALRDRPLAELVTRALDDPVTQTALSVGSATLYDALGEATSRAGRRSSRALLKAHRYIVRMATRCTPFGLFASVAQVPIGSRTTLVLDEQAATAHTRIDMGVIDRLVQETEADRSVRGSLRVFTTDFLKDRGEALVVYRNAPERPAIVAQVLKKTPLIATVTRLAAAGVTLGDLVRSIAAQLDIDEQRAEDAVDLLLGAGLLVSELRADMTRADDGAVLRKRMSLGGPRTAAIAALLAELERLNAVPVAAQSPADYSALRASTASALGPAEYLTQTHGMAAVRGTLGAGVLDDAALLAELLLRSQPAQRLSDIVERFIARYEGEALVPLMDLEGSPVFETLRAPAEPPVSHGFTESGHAALLARILAAIRDGGDVAVEFDEFLGWLQPDDGSEGFPPVVELGFHVAAPSRDALDAGDYLLYPAPYGQSAGLGRSTGRFLHLLPNVEEQLRSLYAEQARDDAAFLAEVVSLPTLPRSLNLTVSARVLPHEIQLGVVDTETPARRLALDDLFLGVSDGRFFVWSRSLRREVIPYRHDNLAIVGSGSDLLDLLSILPFDGVRWCRGLALGDAAKLPYVPRIRVGRVVLSLARWLLPTALRSESAVRAWAREQRAGRYLWVTEKRDQRLFVDLESDAALCQLLSIFAASGEAMMVAEEALEPAGGAWLPGRDGDYAVEFVAQLELCRRSRRTGIRQRFEAPARRERAASPSDGWLYFKLYCDATLQNYVVTNLVRELASEACRRFGVRAWFFLRYTDTRPHLRFRVAIDDPARRAACAQYVWDRIGTALRSGLLDDASQGVYQRELERYGGEAGLAAAEAVFTFDSDEVLTALRSGEGKARRLFSAVESAYALLTAVAGERGAVGWLDSRREKVTLGADERRALKEIASRAVSAENRAACALATVVADLRERVFTGERAAAYGAFVDSLLHMHFNRFGIGGDDEVRALRLLRRLTFSLAERTRALTGVAP
jgi:thiopeptide-type bacteriocin biosynthesis protein